MYTIFHFLVIPAFGQIHGDILSFFGCRLCVGCSVIYCNILTGGGETLFWTTERRKKKINQNVTYFIRMKEANSHQCFGIYRDQICSFLPMSMQFWLIHCPIATIKTYLKKNKDLKGQRKRIYALHNSNETIFSGTYHRGHSCSWRIMLFFAAGDFVSSFVVQVHKPSD